MRDPRGRSRRDNRGRTISNGSRAARRGVGRREGTGKGRMSRRIALVTCADLPDLDPDDRLLLAHLAWHGVTVVPAVWDDPAVDWSVYDLVVLRSPWDYTTRRDEFVAWAIGLPH